jgi:hypothetical protein
MALAMFPTWYYVGVTAVFDVALLNKSGRKLERLTRPFVFTSISTAFSAVTDLAPLSQRLIVARVVPSKFAKATWLILSSCLYRVRGCVMPDRYHSGNPLAIVVLPRKDVS